MLLFGIRRDASILEQELPSKNEFVISCRMSGLQKEIYEVRNL
jgi:SNF2 family DNA or RNA helicase